MFDTFLTHKHNRQAPLYCYLILKCLSLIGRIGIVSILAFLLSCTYQPYESTPGSEQSNVSNNTAVINLFDGAIQDLYKENYEQAEAKLERALRIEPKNPQLWFTLAQSAQSQGHTNEAKNLATRALNHANSHSSLYGQIREFITLL